MILALFTAAYLGAGTHITTIHWRQLTTRQQRQDLPGAALRAGLFVLIAPAVWTCIWLQHRFARRLP